MDSEPIPIPTESPSDISAGFVFSHDIELVAAIGPMGFPVRAVDDTSEVKAGNVTRNAKGFHVDLVSSNPRFSGVRARKVIDSIRYQSMWRDDPNHPALFGYQAIQNMKALVKHTHTGANFESVNYVGSRIHLLKPGDNLPAHEDKGNLCRSQDISIVVAAITVGAPFHGDYTTYGGGTAEWWFGGIPDASLLQTALAFENIHDENWNHSEWFSDLRYCIGAIRSYHQLLKVSRDNSKVLLHNELRKPKKHRPLGKRGLVDNNRKAIIHLETFDGSAKVRDAIHKHFKSDT